MRDKIVDVMPEMKTGKELLDSFLYPLIRNSTVLLQDSRPLDHYAYLTELYHTIPL